ncbi:MAG TPA: aminoacetone oxidase family FAD-binding enzyme [Rhodospirillaceae bacterium]|nr:aminoacetone oxidase family FAD-binding enzyme [Rhodospirillaceae bacterium]
MNMKKNIAIIGGGPAGLMAAEKLSAGGVSVTVYDAMPSVGRKFLMAGSHGGLNLTHSEELNSFLTRYRAATPHMDAAISSFPPQALIDWCHGLGQETFIGTSGRVFPVVKQSKNLLRAWLKRLEEQGVRFAPRHRWTGWNEQGELAFETPDGEVCAKPDATLLALGGASWPRTGSNGAWVDILSRENVALAPLEPSNCGFIVPWSPYFSGRFAGQPLKPVTLTVDGKTLQGELMITDKGIEGSVVYALSGVLREQLHANGKAIVHVDLRHGLSCETLVKHLQAPRKAQSFSTYLRKAGGLSAVAIGLLREMTPPESLPINDIEKLAKLIKALPLTLTATAPMARAISTAGGVRFDALDEHFMLRDKAGVFVAGEMLDWDAPTGGYLLQGCFSTGVAAAQGIAKYLRE